MTNLCIELNYFSSRCRFQDHVEDEDDDTSTSNDDAEMQSEESDDQGLAVDPVGQSPNPRVCIQWLA